MANALAVKEVAKETVDIVADKVRAFQNSGELIFPANYVPENALKSAWLIIQETTNMDKKPVLEVCTKESIANSLLSMVVQGLNPDKKQCYFIAYGNKLNMQRSYFGSMHVAKTVDENIDDIFPDVVYEGDEFEYSKVRGKTIVTKHIQKLENVNKSKIIAAYCIILYLDGKEEATIMTLEQIKQSWKMSKMNPVDNEGNIKAGSTHDKYMADMCMKTVANKACKIKINSSDDRNLVVRYAKLADDENTEARVEQAILDNANGEIIDIDDPVITEPTTQPDVKQSSNSNTPPSQPTEQLFPNDDGPGF